MKKNIVVKINGIGKKYSLGDREKYLAIRDLVVKAAKVPINLLRGKKFKKKKEFWALKDISFEVEKGDVVGIIGRNGAGKSTLLKILSRITEPTEGEIEYRGRVASLLEVGTGFHPELTGRENVYLNGAILGMKRSEIDEKFDEIIDFSGVREFIDIPVKRYSSGMQVRLAFSVAAHLDSDILIIDEVLAVGDAEFQKKCLGKMDQVTKDKNRTIFFVSHDLNAVRRICNKCVYLEDGKIKAIGETSDVINKYLTTSSSKAQYTFENSKEKDIYIKKISILNEKGEIDGVIPCTQQFQIEVEYEVTKEVKNYQLSFVCENVFGGRVFTASSFDQGMYLDGSIGIHQIRYTFPKLDKVFLNPATYSFSFGIGLVNSRSVDLAGGVVVEIIDDERSRSSNQQLKKPDLLIVNGQWR